MGSRLRARVGLGLLSIAGMTAGHFLAYWLAAPDAHHRDELLEATGHSGESPFGVTFIAALLAACIVALVGRSRRTAPRFVTTAAALMGLQTMAFVGLEAAERVGAHLSLSSAVQEPVFLLGLAAQAVVALVGALLIRGLHVASTTIASRPPKPSFLGLVLVPPPPRARSRRPDRSRGARSPPPKVHV